MIYRLLLLLLVFINVNSHATIKQDLFSNEYSQVKTTAEELLLLLPNDKSLGNPKAPVLMIEYASLTCYHCSIFHKEVFPAIKKKYIDTGKMLYIFRHFPLDYRGLKAAMLSYCYEEEEDYFNYNRAVFNSIDSWNYSDLSDLTVLQRIAALSNLKQDLFSKCIDEKENKEALSKIINDKSVAIKELGIMATPVFFIKLSNDRSHTGQNEIKHEGHKTLGYLTKVIDKLYEKATAE